ncbi:F0F1 ATP synthase subunit gamma [Mesosutterella sp. OilRF-GAM-744-9]|uniref:ATP synthase gamma chain n=1 Tax=Mesosutterella porci TaxID=2915351 RepID=A0ABS9MNG6_9BURK|nr:F0F1 ATP synthase subunit gamma [Mesosutterella sp. oilRF-744-WT-GAM-9]MCG5030164.1 F0F1 ATP synthase subunit gamma [Mesosutterella sp. oilRF-744-WT-GAM-9]
MPSTKEIRLKIKSVNNTRKITNAMQMVAASKMRKAQDRMFAARPYGEDIRRIISHLASSHTDYRHPFLASHNDAKKIGLILITTDKGLAGALNTNILRDTLTHIKQWNADGNEIFATAIGNKGLGFLQRLGMPVQSQVIALGDKPNLDRLIGAIRVQFEAYAKGEVSAVYLAYTRFINAMKQEPVFEQLLPLPTSEMLAGEPQKQGAADSQGPHYTRDYEYEPSAQAVLDLLLNRYVEALIYQAVAENMASEQSARMVAMKAATDNAKKLADELQLVFNKTRQAAITKEITEIVGGAAAVS